MLSFDPQQRKSVDSKWVDLVQLITYNKIRKV